ncbi:MAG: hypothetical protein QOF45_1005 [Gaiellaceae bacterium]|jgi:cytochrome P450|nr:hypothetical protein [Gaiellaceae bacterium]
MHALDERLASPEIFRDPYAVYAALRADEPVFRSEALGQWLVTDHDHVVELMHSPQLFSNFGWELARLQRLPPEVQARVPTLERLVRTPAITFSDPPEHTRLRRLVVKRFTPRTVTSSSDWIQALTSELLDSSRGGDTLDIVGELAYPLPLRVIAHLFGARDEDVEIYKQVSSTRVVWQGSPTPRVDIADRYEALLIEFKRYLTELFERLRAAPDGSLLSSLLAPDDAGEVLDDEEVIHTCVIFLSAGHETTTALIANAVLALANNPEQLQLLSDDRELVPRAVEEALRWASPIQRVLRVALEDCELGGKSISAGDVVVAVLAGANRDPAHFSDPDAFDIMREDGGHVALGHGIHYCVGAGLARLEAGIALNAILDRYTELRLPAGWEPSWVESISTRTLDALPVLVNGRAPSTSSRPSGEQAPEPGAAAEDTPGFEEHVRPLFRQEDVSAMRFLFDLSSYDDVRQHADAILGALEEGTMPCDGGWPAESVDTFRRWVAAGMAA